jgi:hypothetical protein
MTKIDNFIKSTLKVTASEDIDVKKDLEAKNVSNKNISELLEEADEKKTK